MAPLYNKALIIGATSGIGAALAAKLVSAGTKVIVTGRRQSRLDDFVEKHGGSGSNQLAWGAPLDITDLASLAPFIADITRSHPDIDAVIINAGIQRGHNFAEPESIDLDAIQAEFTTNYLAYVHLVKAVLPHLMARAKTTGTPGHLVLVSSMLALLPTLTRSPNYNATKAALHAFAMNLRQQLADAGKDVRVVEAFPPAVQTELHDEKGQPDLVGGGALGMPLDECIEEFYAGLASGEPQFGMGWGKAEFGEEGRETKRLREYEKGQVTVMGSLAAFMKK